MIEFEIEKVLWRPKSWKTDWRISFKIFWQLFKFPSNLGYCFVATSLIKILEKNDQFSKKNMKKVEVDFFIFNGRKFI